MKAGNVKFYLSYIVILYFILHPYCTFSQDSKQLIDVKHIFYKAYLTSNTSLWQEGINKLKAQYENSPDNYDLLLNIARAENGLLRSSIYNKDKGTFKKFIRITEKNVDILLQHNDEWVDALVLKAGIYTMKMAFSPIKAMTLGPKILKYTNLAYEINNNKPSVITLKASMKLHAPSAFGGDVNEAIKLFEKTIKLYESNPDQLDYNYQYLNALGMQGMALLKAGKKDEAIKVFHKSIKLEPDFIWVKNVLLPEAQKSK